jgi:hypothetical protein
MDTERREWSDEVTDRFVAAVANVRDRTVEPVQRLTRSVVYTTFAIGFAVPAIVVTIIVAFRGIVILANLGPGRDDNVWAAWGALGIAFVGLGCLLFSKRNARPDSKY